MITAKKALAASRVYTQETVIGMGALKGANCTIKSITKTGDLNTVIFEWTDTEGGKHENTMLVYDGAPGTPGQDGDDGFSPTIVVKSSTSTEYILTITDKNGSYDTPNLKGSGGSGGASAMSDLTDVDLTALANGSVLVYDSTAAKWVATALSFADISDVDLTGITDGQILAWDAANSKFVPADNTGEEYTAGMGIDISAQNEISTKFIMFPGTKAEWDLLPTSEKVKYTHTAWGDSQSGIVDNAPTENSDHLVTSGGVFTALSSKANTSDLGTAAAKDSTNAVTEGSTDLVESGAVYTALSAKADTADLGTAAAKDSTNAVTQSSTDLVESGAVHAAIGSAIADLDVSDSAVAGSYVTAVSETDGSISVTREAADTTPTSASAKMLTSGGAYTALADKADKVTSATNGDFAGLDASGNLTDSGKKASDFATAQGLADEAKTRGAMGAKNLIPMDQVKDSTVNSHGTWSGNVYTDNGVEFTFNPENGTVVANGTSNGGEGTHATFYYAVRSNDSRLNMPANTYKLTGCPAGGSSSTYFLYLNTRYQSDNTNNGGMTDDGEGVTATYANDMWAGVYVDIVNGTTVSNLEFKPMLRLASDIDDTYQPYAKTNKELTDEVSANTSGLADEISTRAQLGAHNLNIYPYKNGKAGDVWSTNGIDFTVNSDGSITANGTATADAYFRCGISTDDTNPIHLVSGKKYILSGSGQANVSVRLRNSSNTGVANATTSEAVYECSSTGSYYILLEVPNGITVDNLTIYPMLRLATDSDSTYEPYAKSNQVITEDFQTMYKNNGILGVKNLLPAPYYSTKGGTTTSGTLTVTENADGSVTIDGTASGQSYIDLARNDKFLKAGTYILSGGITSKQYVYINCLNNGTYVKTLASAITSEVKFVLDYNGYDAITVGISIASGESLSNVTFYPMIRLASDTDTTYQPYAKTNRELTVDSVSWKNNALLGAKNLMPNLGASRTIGGCTITVNSDGSFTIVQDSTVSSQTFELFNDANNPIELKAPCILSSGADLSNSQLIATIDGTDYYAHENDKTPIVPAGSLTRVRYYFNSSYTGTRTVYPMLRYAFDTDPTYVPYAMTNRQLSAYEKGNITYSIQATETAMTTIIKVGKVVQCNMMAAIGENVSAWTTFATIPEGFRPAFYVQAVNNKTMYTGFNIIQISPQGTVQSATALASGERLRFTAVWILP